MAQKRIAKKIQGIVRTYSDRLEKKEKLPIEKVIVFGSQINNRAHRWSDIDVCIVSPKFKDALKATTYLLTKRNEDEVRAGIEPIGITGDVFRSGGSFIDEIKRTGVEIK